MRSPRDPGWRHRVTDGPSCSGGRGGLAQRPPRHPSTVHARGRPPWQPVHPGPRLPASPRVPAVVVFLQKHLAKWTSETPTSPHPPSRRAAPRRVWVYLRPSQNGTLDGDGGTTLITDARGPCRSKPGTSTPAVPPRLRHDAVVNADTGPGRAAARRAGAALRSSAQGSRCRPPAPWPPGLQQCRLSCEQGTRTFTRATADPTASPYPHAPRPRCPRPGPPHRAAGPT